MIKEITVEELEDLANPVLIDVRSEGEYAEATIPGALNLPLFNNEERAKVGTAYAQVSPAQARKLGLEFVSPKLPDLVKKAEEVQAEGPLVLFCWRGGMRSKSVASVLDLMGMTVYRLQGGYKAYRRKVVEYFEQGFNKHVVVLRGNTGVGKTEILRKLRAHGYPAIDLEKLANNRGSVFGAIGLGDAPSQKTFESMLFEEIKQFSEYDYVIVECESRRIGRVTVPERFFEGMQSGTQILVYDSLEHRVARLVEEYTQFPDSIPQIRMALDRLVKLLGHDRIDQYHELLNQKELGEFTRRLLVEYYDKLYGYPNEPSLSYEFCLNYEEAELGLRELERFLEYRVDGRREASVS